MKKVKCNMFAKGGSHLEADAPLAHAFGLSVKLKAASSLSRGGGKKILIFLMFAVIVITGCAIKFGSSQPPAVAGVFKSFDKGNNWIERNLFLYSGGVASISGLNVISLTFDPQDNKAIYLASEADGLLYSYDGTDSWLKASGLPNGRVDSVAIDPKNKCVIYATFTNTILKSVDCARSWQEVYIDTRADKLITALAVDHFNNLIIYAGNIAGDILKSLDGGSKWQVIKRFNDKIAKILIYPDDSRIVYFATQSQGIYKTTDSGFTWVDLNNSLKPYSGAFEYKKLIFNPSLPNALLLVAKYGLLKTIDGGASWEPLKLITPPATTDIFSVAVNPEDSKEIYYATASTFYKTVDSGQNWITKRLPTGAVATDMQIDPLDPAIIYLGLSNVGNRR